MTALKSVTLTNFTAFKALRLDLNSGINIFIGANGTGKTHLLKLLYAACSVTDGEDKERGFAQKVVGVFRPYENRPGRLAHRSSGSVTSTIEIARDRRSKISASFSNHTKDASGISVIGAENWVKSSTPCAYIPVKEMLAHAPGFLATVSRREMSFEEVYSDIIKRAYLPKLMGPTGDKRKAILSALQSAIEGKVSTKGEYFFLRGKQGDLEFTLLSEGMRKLALIWILTQNGVLTNGSILFWDEPEANLNPSRMGEVVDVILELQRMGVQIFVSTHNYVLLKEFDLRRKESDNLNYISLFRTSSNEIDIETSGHHSGLTKNKILETYDSIYDRDVENSLKDLKL